MPRIRRSMVGLVAAGLLLGWSLDSAPPAEARPAAPQQQRVVKCNEKLSFLGIDGLRPDKTRIVGLPDDAPEWWVHEVQTDIDGCELAHNPPKPRCPEEIPPPSAATGIPPQQCWGTYPTGNYEVTWDAGGVLDIGQFDDKLQGWLIAVLFNIGRAAVQVALWLVGLAFTFDITRYTRFAASIGNNYETGIVAGFGLEDFAWFVLLAWVGYKALRGRLTMAAGELALSIVLAALATVMFTQRANYMDAIAAKTEQVSGALMVAARGGDPSIEADMVEELRPLQRQLHREFVELPHTYVQWGSELRGRCALAAENIVSTGYDDRGWASRYMSRVPGCEQAAEFNADPDLGRVIAAVFIMLVALVVSAYLVLASATIVIGKFLIALLFTILPFALLGAILPGTGRRLAWTWLGTLVQLVVAVVGMSFLLTLLLLGVEAVLANAAGLGLIERWFLVLLVVGAVFFARRRILTGTKAMGEGIADNLTRSTPGGAHWQGQTRGVDFLGIDRGFRYAGIGAGMGAMAVAGYVATRRAERRAANRNLRNLETMERRREGPYLEWQQGLGGGGGGRIASVAASLARGTGRGGSSTGSTGRPGSSSARRAPSPGGKGSEVTVLPSGATVRPVPTPPTKFQRVVGAVRGAARSGTGRVVGAIADHERRMYSGSRPVVTMRTRAPRSLVPGEGGVLRRTFFMARHPIQSVKQPFQAVADRARLGGQKAMLRKWVKETERNPGRIRANRPARRGWP